MIMMKKKHTTYVYIYIADSGRFFFQIVIPIQG